MIRGQTRVLETPKIEAKLNVSIHNRFDIEIVDGKTGEIKEKAQAENTILNQMWTYMFSASESQRAWNNYIHFGSGTLTPSATDTSLTTFVAAKAVSDVTYSQTAGVLNVREKIIISESEHIGTTITEVGIGLGSSSSTLCTKALLQDMNGNAISINKTDTDIINIYATVYVHWSSAYSNGNVRVLENSTSTLLRWALGKNSAPIIFDRLITNPLSTNSADFTTTLTYDSVSKSVTFPVKRLAASEGNFNGGIMYASGNIFFRLPGNSVLDIPIGTGDGTIADFRSPFGWSSTPAIKIDGIETTSVAVDISKPYLTAANCYFEKITENGRLLGGGAPITTGSDVLFIAAGNTAVFYNPNYLFGINQYVISLGSPTIYASDDLVNWSAVSSTVESDYKQYKYWKIVSSSESQTRIKFIADVTDNTDIHFSSAPLDGAVITASGTTDTVAKDSNHVYDIEVAITFNEYTT